MDDDLEAELVEKARRGDTSAAPWHAAKAFDIQIVRSRRKDNGSSGKKARRSCQMSTASAAIASVNNTAPVGMALAVRPRKKSNATRNGAMKAANRTSPA